MQAHDENLKSEWADILSRNCIEAGNPKDGFMNSKRHSNETGMKQVEDGI